MSETHNSDGGASSNSNFLADTRGHAEGVGGVVLFIIALIGLSGAIVGIAAADSLGTGIIGTGALIVIGFIGVIVAFLVHQLTFIFLTEYLAVAIGQAIASGLDRVASVVLSDSTRETVDQILFVLTIPVVIILMLNMLTMGAPSLFLAVYSGTFVFELIVGAGAPVVLAGIAGVGTGVSIIMAFLGPLAAGGL